MLSLAIAVGMVVMPISAFAITGTATSTFVGVWTTASNISGFSGFTYVSSTKFLALTGSGSRYGILTASPLSTLSIAGTPPQSTTSTLILLDANFITGGNASGTYLGANPSIFNGDFINFEVASSSKFKVAGSGAVTAADLTVTGLNYGVMIASGSSQVSAIAAGASRNVLTSNGSTWSSGLVPAAGSNSQVQYNSSGNLGASGNFTFNSNLQQLELGNTSSSLLIGSNFTNIGTSTSVASSVSFGWTGAVASWTIPTGVSAITINVQGAKGGDNTNIGASGGSTTGTLAVTPGTTYYFCVGGIGGTGSGGVGGTCGGGAGGNGAQTSGGGGMTWFSGSPSFATSSIIIVAGGGGGVTACGPNSGEGGGVNGQNAPSTCNSNNWGGTGGSQTNGGTGGAGDGGTGQNGAAGQGGAGADGTNAGGGGGGGYFGGGGGGSSNSVGSGSGGGGSAFMNSSLSSTSTASGVNNSTGTISFTYNIITGSSLSSDLASSTYSLAVGGHVITGGNQPTASACGSVPNIAGDDTAGIVTVGSGSVSSCQITFVQAYTTAPACTANDNTSFLAIRPQVTTTGLTLTAASSFSGDNISYTCLGY